MADNIGYTPGSGATIALDDISGVLHQRVKVEYGSDGTATEVDATNRLPVVSAGITNVITGSITRPADTTVYAAGDEISSSTSSPTIMSFSGCARANGGSGVVVSVTLIDSANQTTKPQLELWLFDTTSTPTNDNSAFAPSDSVANTLVGIIPLSLLYVGDSASGASGNSAWIGALAAPIPYVCGGSSTSLFGRLVVRNAYTPVSAEVFTVRLGLQQD